jgi:hypothetical protein
MRKLEIERRWGRWSWREVEGEAVAFNKEGIEARVAQSAGAFNNARSIA